ncbi:MAG: hypothetical protein MRJ93_09600 [Nitrososphaeraceae archaeon]|nr:hypothetical protein [Nitrososphaeraceae archaeon]
MEVHTTSSTGDLDHYSTTSLQSSSSYSSINHKIQSFCDVEVESPTKEITFGIKDSIPIILHVKSLALVQAFCNHGIVHNFQFPVAYKIEWIIEGGKEKGAFKIGNGISAKYVNKDTGNCVIFYPALHDISTNPEKKNIKILVNIDQIGLKFYTQEKKKYLLNIDIIISKKNLKSSCKGKISIHSDERNNINNYETSLSLDNLRNELGKENTGNLSIIENKHDDVDSMSIKPTKSCNICNFRILFRPFPIKIGINISRSYLITSEIIKLSTIVEQNGYDSLIITGTNYQKQRLKDITISPSIYWICNIGEFVYGNSGESTIYNTPKESELSKGPVILTLNASYSFLSNSNSDSKQAEKTLSLQKKLWLLRQPAVMGG